MQDSPLTFCRQTWFITHLFLCYTVSITLNLFLPLKRSYSGENTASTIARSCAALGLAMLVPVLVTSHRDAVRSVQDTLQAGLPGVQTADDSQAVQFHSSLALGMLLAWLNEEKVR